MRKVLLGLGLLLVVLLVGGLGTAWYVLSRFDARAEIVQRVKAATGRDFALTGPVSVAVWPAIGFRGEGAALANVAGGRAPHLMEAKAIVVGVALRPLLDRQVEVTRFVLTEPKVALEVDAEGRPNWILRPIAPPRPGAPPARPGAPQQVSDVKLAAEIVDGQISYSNAKTRSAYALADMDLKVAMQGLDSALKVDGDVTFRDKRIAVDMTVGKVRSLMTGRTTPVTATLEADVLKTTLTGDFDVATGGLAGDVTATGPSLRNLASWAGTPLGVGYGLEGFVLRGRLDVGTRRYAFENAGLQIDDIKARGDFVIETGRRVPFLSGRIEIADAAFDPLSGGSAAGARQFTARMPVNLNPYFGAPRQAGAGAVEVAGLEAVDVKASGWSEARLNFGWLKALNTNLEVTTGPLRYQNMQIDNVALSLTVLDGYLSATLQRMELYGGNGSSRMELDARSPSIIMRNELALQNVNARAFFRDAFGFEKLDGTAKLEWGFSSRGATQKEMMSTLAGAGSVSFANGAVSGVDLGGLAKTIRSALRRELIAPTARTPFTNLSASIRAADGVIATQDLRLDASDARLNAIGVIDARTRSVDLRMVPRLGITGFAAPFRVSGPWGQIGYASDLLGRARAEVEGKARAVVARAPAR